MESIKKQADGILCDIRETSGNLEMIQAEADREFELLTEKYGILLEPLKMELKAKEKEIMRLMKSNRDNIFDGRDLVKLKNGILIYNKEEKVKIPRDALAKAEEQGLTEAIKIAKSLDRGVVEKWPDERLFLIGAERKMMEKFSYEVKR